MAAKLFQCMETIKHAVTVADVPVVGTQDVSDLHYMNTQESQYVHPQTLCKHKALVDYHW
jgi:hypothetical protein